MTTSNIDSLVLSLKLPDPDNADATTVDEWRRSANVSLNSIQELVQTTPSLPPELIALVIAHTVPLQVTNSWVDSELSEKVDGIVRPLPLNRDTLRYILSNHVKPHFVPSPHPMLDLNTGRKLPRPAGGAMAMQDYYTTQMWKTQHGLTFLLNWVVSKFKSDDYESLWPLLIPPVMTYIDDYQAQYKLEGVKLVKTMLQTVPPVLLTRSGVGELLYTSLTRTLMALHDPYTPALIRQAIPTTITLINLLNSKDPSSRFDKLCHLLGEGIIGGVWVYASRELDAIEASMDACEVLIRELGIGAVRYLKALVPEFTHCLMQHDLEIASKPTSLQLAVLKALETTIEVCPPRIERWKGRIIEGVAKAWVVLMDNEILFKAEQRQQLRDAMRSLFATLYRCCPAVVADYDELLHRHPDLFSTLLPNMNGVHESHGP